MSIWSSLDGLPENVDVATARSWNSGVRLCLFIEDSDPCVYLTREEARLVAERLLAASTP